MASAVQWIEGARLRTLPAAISPVLAGTGLALLVGQASLLRAGLALLVALALQVGVNFANDYSDGIRGSDADRVGPMRLVGSGAAEPGAVRRAAFGCFAVAALAGGILIVAARMWWLLPVGVACILAAWFYTGGRRPYGYRGWGEVFVFVFFGLVATLGTIWVQVDAAARAELLAPGLALAVAMGALACAVLVANNLRDLSGDRLVGKATLATLLGDRATRGLFAALWLLAVAMLALLARLCGPWLLLSGAVIGWLVPAVRAVLGGAQGAALIRVLKWTAQGQLVAAGGVLVGAALTLAG